MLTVTFQADNSLKEEEHLCNKNLQEIATNFFFATTSYSKSLGGGVA
jgi:hypothetical protein